ncbi:MAG TPA: RNA 2',3'-cyclic phosphodiesterase [Acidobacteriota bacterium]|nr:RNA 2',3'-cyclic phosphodiesterase [Acidobacteriota bacterium]
MIRSFVALPVPEPVRAQAATMMNQIRRLGVPVRCPLAASLHLSLTFLGDIEESDIAGIQSVLETAAHAISPFKLETTGPGAFPASGSPRVVWLGIAPSPELMELQKRVCGGLSSLGFQQEQRPFLPHLTLARVKGRKGLSRLRQWIEKDSDVAAVAFPVECLALYQSVLQPTGARYRRLATVAFGLPS